MSAIEEAIYTKASGDATIATLVATRIYGATFPEGATWPAVAYFRVSTARTHTMVTEPKLAHGRFQFTAAAKERTAAQDLAEAVRAAFSRWRGTVDGVEIQDTFVEDVRDLPFDIETELHLCAVDAMIHFREN